MIDHIFRIIYEGNFIVATFRMSKSYKFYQNRIFVAEFNVTQVMLENITLNDYKTKFAENAISYRKIFNKSLIKSIFHGRT